MSDFFKNKYDPSVEDIQKVFPDFEYTTKESWISQFSNNYLSTPSQMAEFAYKKLDKVTTSYRLTDAQRPQLQQLISDIDIDTKVGWERYCSILAVKQLDYVGY